MDTQDAHSQAHGGASNIFGHLAGLSTFIKNINTLTTYTHCMANRLCLVVEKTGNNVAPYRDVLGILQNCILLCHRLRSAWQ